jgi:energy-coupling factor transporter ATP-binding protein EcfA2
VKIKFSDVIELGSRELTINSPLSIICGENGVGKSSLLWIIYRALSAEARVEGGHRSLPPKLPSGTVDSVELSLQLPTGVRSFTNLSEAYKELDDDNDSPPVVFIDPTFQIPELVRTIRADNNFTDLLEGVKPLEMDKDNLELVCVLVGKAYGKISIYEIENYAEYEVFPYFKVETDGVTYGSENMGLGELSLLYTFWKISTIDRPSIVLLEEPETFVAPRSQRALIDIAAKFTNDKKLFVIISSHSGIIAGRVPNTHLNLVTKGNPNVVIAPNPAAHLLIERLGLFSYKSAVLLVEDASAKALLSAILFNQDSRLASSCEISIAGSDSEITTALKSLPSNNLNRFRLVGVYDGDARNKPEIRNAEVVWPKIFLPGDACPEIMIQVHVRSLGIGSVAKELARTEVAVETAFGGAAGKNHHDWLLEVCAALRMDIDEFFERLTPSWILANEALATGFAQQIKAAIL